MNTDVVCFSHLRWNFVFQRPNHLMTRCARKHRVYFVEEPLVEAGTPQLRFETVAPNLVRVVPVHPRDAEMSQLDIGARLLDELSTSGCKPVHWFYTPMMLGIAECLPCSITVYDCMDELANFLHAPPQLRGLEQALIAKADLMFTGGRALYEAKREQHSNLHALPSAVDFDFFARARQHHEPPADQRQISAPRIGYCGVIDERVDLGLLDYLATRRPQWQFVMLGPVAKIDLASLPRHPNIHYLGAKSYDELPVYLSGWDVALLPFALNDATRYISPTKTPEYLAAGRPVVSTAIRDVVEPYERLGLVRVARSYDEFERALEAALAGVRLSSDRERDDFLRSTSWDATWCSMERLMRTSLSTRMTDPPRADVSQAQLKGTYV